MSGAPEAPNGRERLMRTLSILSGVAFASLVLDAARADPGLHAHPHFVATTRPLLDLHPTLGLAATLMVWAAVVIGVEAVARRRRPGA